MAPQQRIKVANEKAQRNITLRGNVPKSNVRTTNNIFIQETVLEISIFFSDLMFYELKW